MRWLGPRLSYGHGLETSDGAKGLSESDAGGDEI